MPNNIVANNWRQLIKPKNLEIEKESHSEFYGKFVAAPLERGFGLTIGNSLRRILLSSIQGAAIVSLKVDGVLHEFSSIPGVKEDVTDIILNLKGVKLKLHDLEEDIIRIEASGAGEITAGDISLSPNVEIMNPEHHIATLSEDAKFIAELKVKVGKGYVPAEMNKTDMDVVGVIPIDALFSPIVKVNYNVTNARVGRSTDYDKLALELWSDGSVLPEDALAYASKILKEQLTTFINFEEEEEPEEITYVEESSPFNDNLNKRVEELELSVRSANCLQNAEIKYIGELVQKSEGEMLRTKNFGRKSLNEIKEILSEMGLGLGMKIEGWQEPVETNQEKEKRTPSFEDQLIS
ncbi:MAG: DNA-directed RNA polymerase subunit alpha [Deltaproteobacteria bacterium]|nr:DNA-directed RNA polymerase subunit alpha [Deltaproteobacteria bacterium]